MLGKPAHLETISPQANGKYSLGWLLAVAAFLLLFRLGATGLWAPDEPRFAAVAEELRSFEHGAAGVVVLHLNGEPYTQKPPLYYWVTSLLSSVGGSVNEVTARLPSAIAGVGCVWLTALFATAISRRPLAGVISGALLLTVFRFAHLARRAQLDVILSFFLLLALYAFFRLRDGEGKRDRWFYLLHASIGLGVMTKGPVALLPIAAMALVLLWQGDWGRFRQIVPWWSFGLSLGPALVWLALAVAWTPPGYFEEAVVQNIFGRFFSGTAHVRSAFYFFVHFPLEFLPWTLLWPLAAGTTWRALKQDAHPGLRDGSRLLVVWIALCFVFFSLSAGKRGLYLLPTFPAVAILCGLALDDFARRKAQLPRTVWIALGTLAIVALGFSVALVASGGIEFASYPGFKLPAHFGKALGIATLGASAITVAAMRSQRPVHVQFVAPFVGALLLEVLVFAIAYPAFDSEKSPRLVAQAAARASASGTAIGVYDQRALAGGVAFYSGHPVVNLRTSDSVRDFLANQGSAIVIKESKLPLLDEGLGLAAIARSRSGKRTLLVVRAENLQEMSTSP
jgi:4-amino-4-deoxy-L-arabinose transferase-like glycosyltransferase